MSQSDRPVRSDITRVGRVVPGAADDGSDQLRDWAFNGRRRPGTVGAGEFGGVTYLSGWTEDELRQIAALIPEGAAIMLDGDESLPKEG